MLFPGLLVASSAALFGLGATGPGGVAWWAAVPLLGVIVPAGVFAWWVHGRGALDPAAWLKSAFLAAGVQLLLGVIPSYGIAANTASGPGQVAATGIFALCWVLAALSCLRAHHARRTLLEPMIPELGSTPLRLAVAVRFALTAHDLVSARFDVGTDRVSWSARRHRGRDSGPRVDATVLFGQLQRVTPVALPAVPELRPWLTLPDGTTLYAQPGPAVVLSTASGEWMLPVHDAFLVAELINRRRALWAQRNR